MSELELQRKAEIEAMELTEEEVKDALNEAKIKKWFAIKNNPYWHNKEFGSKSFAFKVANGFNNTAIVIICLFLFSSCSMKVNLTKQDKVRILERRYSRFKLSEKDVMLNTLTFFVGYSMGNEVRKRIDSR